MPRPHFHIHLSKEQAKELHAFIQSCRPSDKLWARRRAQVVLASHEGKTIHQLAQKYWASERAVRAWLKSYQRSGISGLIGRLKGRSWQRKSRTRPILPQTPPKPPSKTKFKFVSPQDQTTVEDKSIMSPKQVASYLNLSLCTIYRLVRQGRLPGARIGGQWRFRKEDVYAYFSRRLSNLSKRRMHEMIKYPPSSEGEKGD